MLGKPKFNYGDSVKFEINSDRDYPNEKYILYGVIRVIDEYGIFEDNSDVYYDITVTEGDFPTSYPCLFKHIKEDKIELVDKKI